MSTFKICSLLIGLSVVLGFLGPSSVTLAQTASQPTAARGQPAAAPERDWRSPKPDTTPFDPHDLNGTWATGSIRNTTGKEVPPFTPAGKALFDANKPSYSNRGVTYTETNDPMRYCDPVGFPRVIFYEFRHMEFVQTPSKVVQLFQLNATWREIWTDSRKLPTNAGKAGGPDLRWFGYSVGRWDGNTFVVETTGADERSWLDEYGDPHSGDIVVEERYTRMDHDTMKLTVTVDDPKMYTKPFVAQPGLTFHLEPSISLPEQICVPSDMEIYRQFAAGADGQTNNK